MVKDSNSQFENLLKHHLLKNRITQKELAKAIGKSSAFVSRLVSGQKLSTLRIDDLLKLARQGLRLSAVEEDELIRSAYGLPVMGDVEAYRRLLLHNPWFLENFDKNSDAKAALAHRMLTDDNLLGKPDPGESLFFDGGSTCNAVAHAIVDHRNTVAFNDVFTNNFVAAFYMASHGISCWLIGGRLDIGAVPEAYGALIGEFALHALESVSSDITTYVISTNALVPEKGPYARARSLEFKRKAIENALKNQMRLIFIADFSKLLTVTRVDRPIVDDGSWNDTLLKYDGMFVVVGGSPKDPAEKRILSEKARAFEEKLGPRFIHAEVDGNDPS